MAKYYVGSDGKVSKSKVSKNNNYVINKEGQVQLQKINKPSPKSTNYDKNISDTAQKLTEARKNYSAFLNENSKINNKTTSEVRSEIYQQAPNSNRFQEPVKKQTALNPLEASVAKSMEMQKASKTEKGKELSQTAEKAQQNYNYARYEKRLNEVENKDINLANKIFNPIFSGAADLVDFSKLSGQNYYVDEEGNKQWLPTKMSLKQQKISSESTGVGKVYNDVAYNLSKAAASKAIDAITQMPVGSMLYYGDIARDSVEEAKNQGFSNKEALIYGSFVTAVAGTLDRFIGNMGGLTKINSKVPELETGLSRVFSKIMGSRSSVLLSKMSSEAISEFTEEYVDNIGKYAINHEDSESFGDMLIKTLPDALYSSLIGGISGGVGGALNRSELNEQREALENYKKTLEETTPNTITEANYKEDELNKIEDKLDEIDQIENNTKEESPVKEEVVNDKKTETKEEPKKVKEETKKVKEEVKEEPKKVKEEKVTEKPVEDGKAKVLKAKYEALTMREKNSVDQIIKLRSELKEGKLSTASANNQIGKLMQGLPKNAKLYLTEYTRYNAELMRNKASEVSETLEVKERKYTKEDIVNDGKNDYDNILKYIRKKGEKVNDYADFDGTKEDYEAYLDKKLNKIANPTKSVSEYSKLSQENNYTKEQTNVAEKIEDDVIRLATDESDKKDLDTQISPPSKTQKTSTIKTLDGNDTKHYNPSQDVVNKGEKAIYDNIRSKTTKKEETRVEKLNKKVNTTLLKAIDNANKNNNPTLANLLKSKIDDYTYTVEHMGEKLTENYEKLVLKIDSGETDIESEYGSLMKEYRELVDSGEWYNRNKETNNSQASLDWCERANTLLTLLRDDTTGTYDNIVFDMEEIIDMDVLHRAGQDLAMASVMARRNPNYVYKKMVNDLAGQYKKDLQSHKNDLTWIKENDPYDLTNNSPYRLNDAEKNTLITMVSDLKKIDQKENNFEYQKKLNEINNFMGETMVKRLRGIKNTITKVNKGIVSLIKQNNLLSVHVGMFNISSNVADTIGLNQVTRVGTNIAERKLANITGFKTVQYDSNGASIHRKGVIEGLKAVGTEFMTGVKMSDMNVKYGSDGKVNFDNLGKSNYTVYASTKVGKVLAKVINAEGRVVSGWMGLGDTPKSTAVRNESLFSQLQQEAIRQSVKTGKDSIFYTLNNDKAGNITYYYTDSEGNTQSKTFKKSEASGFLNDRNQVEATDYMLDIAKSDGEKAVYSNHNVLNDKASKFKDALNSLFPGLGDVTLQFTSVANNMLIQTYKHSPLALPEMYVKTKTLKKNQTLIENNINKYQSEGKDYTKTNDYKDNIKQQYELQHELGQSFGKILAGSAASSLAVILKSAGIITGDEDDDKNKEGIQDYSIKIGDKYYSYDFGLFGMVAGSANSIQMLTDVISGDGLSSLGNYGNRILEQSFINELVDTFSGTYGDSFGDVLKDFGIKLFGSISAPSFVKEITLAMDDYTARSTYSNDKWEYLVNTFDATWDRDKLPKKFDGWGNTIRKGTTLVDSAWNTFFKRDFMSTKKDSSVSKEIAEIYQLTGETGVLPTKGNGIYKNAVNSFSYDKTKYNLDKDDKAEFAQTYGKTAYNNLERLFKSDLYKNADNETKVKYIKEMYEDARDTAKKQYLDKIGVNYYNKGKKVIMMGENDRFENAAILDALDNNISYDAAKAMQSNPQKYRYATMISKNYEVYSSTDAMYNQIKESYPTAAQRKTQLASYVNTLNLPALNKAMIIKTYYSSMYKSYDNQIKNYLKNQGLNNEDYKYALDQMGIK